MAVMVSRPKVGIPTQASGDLSRKGLVFVMHGLGGFKEQPHIVAMAEAFVGHGYTAVRFDTTNTFGESVGKYEEATTTNYYEDLEDVINWAAMQAWYMEPFVLVGHSLGGLCTALYAEHHPEKVKAVAPISTVVSGVLSMDGHGKHDEWRKWKGTGWREEISKSTGKIKRLPYSHMEDRLKYDLLPEVRKLIMPVLLVVGELDDGTPPEHQKILYDALPGAKELHIIKGAPHTFREAEPLAELKKIIRQWLTTI